MRLNLKTLTLAGSLLLSGLVGCSSAYADTVSGVVEVGHHTVTKERPYIVLLRDVCTKKDIEMIVSRTYKDVKTGRVISPSLHKSGHYSFKAKQDCYPEEFRIPVSDELSNGLYVYNATSVIRSLEGIEFIELPQEIVLIKRD